MCADHVLCQCAQKFTWQCTYHLYFKYRSYKHLFLLENGGRLLGKKEGFQLGAKTFYSGGKKHRCKCARVTAWVDYWSSRFCWTARCECYTAERIWNLLLSMISPACTARPTLATLLLISGAGPCKEALNINFERTELKTVVIQLSLCASNHLGSKRWATAPALQKLWWATIATNELHTEKLQQHSWKSAYTRLSKYCKCKCHIWLQRYTWTSAPTFVPFIPKSPFTRSEKVTGWTLIFLRELKTVTHHAPINNKRR